MTGIFCSHDQGSIFVWERLEGRSWASRWLVHVAAAFPRVHGTELCLEDDHASRLYLTGGRMVGYAG